MPRSTVHRPSYKWEKPSFGRAYIERSGWLSPAVRRYALTAMDHIQFKPSRIFRGTIQFGASTTFDSLAQHRSGLNPPTLDRFEDIPDVRHVYALLLATRNAQSGARGTNEAARND